MKFTKIKDVKSPTGRRGADAGIDFYIPNDWDGSGLNFNKEKEGYELRVGQQVNILSGIKVDISEGYELQLENKSSIALKKGIVRGACVIDHSYRGEISINLQKSVVGTEDYDDSNNKIWPYNKYTILKPNEKIIQGILIKISDEEIEEINNEEYDLVKTVRMSGAFGSTD